ncbi:MAG: 13E12 repeat family protein [Actinobacteria bacterium]|nr:13E12 repeat family protein [Actinomycetota bacterium]
MYVRQGSYNFTELREAEGQIASAQLRQLRELSKIDRCRVWERDGHRDMVHWLKARYGIGALKAKRWLDASYAIADLPLTAKALASGELGLDKVVELVRFAKPDTEAELIKWAKRVTFGSVRGKADVECAPPAEEVEEVERGRKLEWWYSDGGTRFGLMADLPAADGGRVAAALDRLAAKIRRCQQTWVPTNRGTRTARRLSARGVPTRS